MAKNSVTYFMDGPYGNNGRRSRQKLDVIEESSRPTKGALNHRKLYHRARAQTIHYCVIDELVYYLITVNENSGTRTVGNQFLNFRRCRRGNVLLLINRMRHHSNHRTRRRHDRIVCSNVDAAGRRRHDALRRAGKFKLINSRQGNRCHGDDLGDGVAGAPVAWATVLYR